MEEIIKAINSNLTTFASLLGSLIILGFLWVLNKFLGTTIINKVSILIKSIIPHSRDINPDMQRIINATNTRLAVALNEFDASRAYILEFHNGSEFSSRFPQWRLSNTYEQVKPGISLEGVNLQNIPVSLIWDGYIKVFFEEPNENNDYFDGVSNFVGTSCSLGCKNPKKVVHFDVKNMAIDNVRSILEKQGILHMLQTPIFDYNKKMVGILGFDYCVDFNNIDINPCDICVLASHFGLLWTDPRMQKELMASQKKLMQK